MYDWRRMTADERRQALETCRARKLPWHSPPHLDLEGTRRYLVSAVVTNMPTLSAEATSEMTECEDEVVAICHNFCESLYAWCILPNHYHVLVKTDQIRELRRALGQFHGRSSFKWNNEDRSRGRKVWHNCFERPIKTARHFWATLNYIHHNPVHHGYVDRWQDWPWSSAPGFLETVGYARALELWLQYPVLDYGRKWDR